MKTTAIQALALLLISTAAGLAYNAAREKNSIDIGYEYMKDLRSPRENSTGGGEDTPHAADEAPNHGFKILTGEEVWDLVEQGDSSIVLVDARNDSAYEKGHIENAIQFDYYNADKYLDEVLMVTYDAEMVIAYCNGGQCVDSIQAAMYLTAEIPDPLPIDRMYLYEGGIKEWCQLGGPIEGTCEEE